MPRFVAMHPSKEEKKLQITIDIKTMHFFFFWFISQNYLLIVSHESVSQPHRKRTEAGGK